jgi:hypothetical protein
MEEQLPARLSKGQIAEFIEDDEVHSGEIFREAPLTARSRLGLQSCDEFDGVKKSAAFSSANATSGDRYGEMRLAGSRRGRDMAPDFWRVKRLFTMPSIL